MSEIFTELLIQDGKLKTMPPIKIKNRPKTDKKVVYDKKTNRLDRISGDVYEDETLYKIILWANPDYYQEYDIPDRTIIRVPWPKRDVLQEIREQIIQYLTN